MQSKLLVELDAGRVRDYHDDVQAVGLGAGVLLAVQLVVERGVHVRQQEELLFLNG